MMRILLNGFFHLQMLKKYFKQYPSVSLLVYEKIFILRQKKLPEELN